MIAPSGASFSFTDWHPHPDVWLLVGGLAGAYLFAVKKVAPRKAPRGEPAVTGAQAGAFLLGLITLWIAADWPVHELSEDYLFSVHMTQHLLFSLVAPPLLLLGLPRWLLRTLLAPAGVKKIVRFATRPLVALILFNGVIVVTHWPELVNLSLRSEPVHLLLHAVLLSSALAMWWPVIAPLPELASLSEPGKMFYLFLQSIVPTVPAAFLTFSNKALYSSYDQAPRLWGISAVTDQMVAGLIMKLVGGFLLWAVIAIVFFKWYAREERQEAGAVSWDDFERELEAWNLRK